MIEPKPASVLPPPTEPTLRIGIVLEEDQKKSLVLLPKNQNYMVEGATTKLLNGNKYSVELQNGRIKLSGVDNLLQKITLIPESSKELAIDTGLVIDSITVGRSFHWRKEVALTFPAKIEILVSKDNLVVVNEISYESYVTCVIASEMGNSCPQDFMKSQAICARSWALCFLGSKHPGQPFTICNDDDCQRYQGTSFIKSSVIEAVQGCRGEFLIYSDGNLCPAYYSKSCGGKSEETQFSMGFEVKGIIAVDDPYCSTHHVPENTLPQYLGAVDEHGKYYRWDFAIEEAELRKIVSERQGLNDITEIQTLIPGTRGKSGRIVALKLEYTSKDGKAKTHEIQGQYQIRRSLHPSFLLSSAFEVTKNGGQFHFSGNGWGHGVGFCQIGALGMALKGKNYRDILSHYFPAYTLKRSY